MEVIKLMNSADYEKVMKFLECEGIKFETGTSFEAFCIEEADFRLGNLEDYENVELPEELRSEVVGRIYDRWCNEDILDYDYMDDIVDEALHHVLGENDLDLDDFKK